MNPVSSPIVPKSRFLKMMAVAALVGGTFSAQAALVTSDAGYSGPFIDLSGRVGIGYGFTYGPVALPGMTFTRENTTNNSGLGAVLGQGGYGLNDNGSFGGDAVYAGTDGPTGFMRFALTGGPVASFGAYVNYAVDGGNPVGDSPVIRVLDSMGGVLESYDLLAMAPISTPGGFNAFEFRGITRSTADIAAIEFGGSYIIATGTRNGDVKTPAPSVLSLALLGLLGIVGQKLRRKV